VKSKRIYITEPSLPPLEEFIPYLEEMWETKQLTNNGPFHQRFEKELAEYLGVKYVSVFTNGTLALIIALQALNVTGEVITTPFSFVATSHALWWNKIEPVFVDIEPETLTLDPDKVKAAINENTTAIMPVHVYGNPCKIEQLAKIADEYNLKLIYDAAHVFGVKVDGKSILNYGDLSVLSFHATKVFNTIEGGAIICYDEDTKNRIDNLKNFGIVDETTVVEPGINAKMNELQAAYGLLQLKYIDHFIELRKNVVELYRRQLRATSGINILDDDANVRHNYAYFPIFVDPSQYGTTRDELYDELKLNNVFGRRYFYPLISHFSPYNRLPSARPTNLPIAEKVARQVICLPLYPQISEEEVLSICQLIQR
jgi:dTDP-4-amino-4,6-dideoxygalactose transaminase